jgi:hypothetical protein
MHHLQAVASDANTSSSLTIGWIQTVPHPYIECRHSCWLKSTKVTSSYLIQLNIWKPSAAGSPTGWTPLELTCGGRNCLVLRFPAPNPTTGFQTLGYTRILSTQLINQNQTIDERLNVSVI